MLALTDSQWTRLYKEVLHIALSITHSDDPKQAYTRRDWAREAVQRACLRYLETAPTLESAAAVRDYLLGAVRSSLGNAAAHVDARRAFEGRALVEQATVTGVAPGVTRSVEALHLAKAEVVDDAARAARLLRALEARLKAAGDTLTLDTLRCTEKGIITAEAQAQHLGCNVADIYNARKRRMRAMEQVVAADAHDATAPDSSRAGELR